MRPTLLIIATLLVALVAAPAATAGPKDKAKARKLLADKVFIRFTETGSVGNESSLDERLHLCRNSDYIFDSVSSVEGLDPQHTRYTGTWKVVSARIKKGGKRGSARVRGTPDDGSPPTTIRITFDGNVTRVDGSEVIVEASDLC
jgi:hypothetical protein